MYDKTIKFFKKLGNDKSNNHQIHNGVNSHSTDNGFESRKFLFISYESLSGDLAWQLAKEGHQVKCYIKTLEPDVYRGFIETVDSWESYKDWADIVVIDDVSFGDIAEKLRKNGKLVVGGSKYTDMLEMNREFGQNELKKYGVNILPQWQFSDYDEAIGFLKTNPDRYVIKPAGSVISANKDLLFIGQEEDGNDLIELLSQNKLILQKKVPTVQIQKFVNGVEIAVGAFFNGRDFIMPINVNFEHKRVFPGDIGPLSGEMGTLMFWGEPNYLFKATLEKMKPSLMESGYIGYIDLNCIVNGKGIYPLEFTTRFGYPTIPIQMEGITMPTGDWLYKLARGEDFELKTKRGFQIGIRIFVPTCFVGPKDKETLEMYHDLPILFKKPDNIEGIHIEDVKREDGIWRIAGTSGCLLVVTSSGSTVSEARQQVYTRIKNIMIHDMFYRTDVGLKWQVDSDKLQTWGYL